MEVGQSIRSRQIDYGNRPKRPRNFNISTQNQYDLNQEEENNDFENENEPLQEYFSRPYEEQGVQSFERYCKTIENQDNNEEPETCAALNFLD